MPRSLEKTLNGIGLAWVTVLLIALMSSLIYMAPSLWQTWTHEGPTLVNPAGFVTGHDFVAFYAASAAVLEGEATQVYDESYMSMAQIDLVGSDQIGYLAFMYPPTFLVLTAPLAYAPYFVSLAIWQLAPYALYLLLLSRIPINRIGLILAAAAPAAAQALFAGQNGLLLAVFLGGGVLALGGARPVLGGILFGLATIKPHLAVLIVPALIAGGQWRALGAMAGAIAALTAMSIPILGVDIWYRYLEIPTEVREYLAQGQLPWTRMPTIYTAARQAGLSDFAGWLMQSIGTGGIIAGIAWGWSRSASASPALRSAILLAGAPLATPFMYDYDLPFMVFALAFYLFDSAERSLHISEKLILLLVWLQPVWWWWLAIEYIGLSPSPFIYALFFGAILYRIRRRAGTAASCPA